MAVKKKMVKENKTTKKTLKTVRAKSPDIKERLNVDLTTPSMGIGNIIAIVVVIALVGLTASFLTKFNTAKNPVGPAVASVQTINYDCPEGQTALAVLKEENEVKTQESSLGLFVDAINNTSNTDNSFWIFYVNGQMGQVGADQYTCQNGDKIEWRFEKIL